jgi:uncharacterized membrane protein
MIIEFAIILWAVLNMIGIALIFFGLVQRRRDLK